MSKLSHIRIPDFRVPAVTASQHLHTYLTARLLGFLILLFFTLVLTSCAIVNYKGNPDGSTDVSIYSLGTDKVLEGFQAGITKTGDRSVSIGSYEANQTEGMRQVNEGMKMIVEGAAKGAVAGAK